MFINFQLKVLTIRFSPIFILFSNMLTSICFIAIQQIMGYQMNYFATLAKSLKTFV